MNSTKSCHDSVFLAQIWLKLYSITYKGISCNSDIMLIFLPQTSQSCPHICLPMHQHDSDGMAALEWRLEHAMMDGFMCLNFELKGEPKWDGMACQGCVHGTSGDMTGSPG